jgi:mRNA interferase RelE/StbE
VSPTPGRFRRSDRLHLVGRLRFAPRPSRSRLAAARDLNHPLRTGDYRIAYEIDDDVLVVLVLTIGHRREVYRKL